MSIIKCGMVGALVAFVLLDSLMPHDTNEGKAWAEFALVMMGLSGVPVGFAIGVAFGVVRNIRHKHKPT